MNGRKKIVRCCERPLRVEEHTNVFVLQRQHFLRDRRAFFSLDEIFFGIFD